MLLVAVVVGSLPLGVLAAEPPGQDQFMHALGEVESGGRYDARNPSSGAYGKYQIMPASWRAWARRYLGSATAPPTPRNQEIVARAKVADLKRWLRLWPIVAHWWLTGSSSRDVGSWSDSSVGYVQRVMAIFRALGGQPPPVTRPAPKPAPKRARAIGDANPAIIYAGGWKPARFGAYSGTTVRYAERAGATATFTFTGRSISWVGPKGPTRGQARVVVDGRPIRTVDLRAGRFQARATVFTRSWAAPGRHSIRIVVLGTRGRPIVAIDEFVVRP
ncbi:MAG TPA: transglycosylase family protein [Candidatus Limnocylindrales bacterium]